MSSSQSETKRRFPNPGVIYERTVPKPKTCSYVSLKQVAWICLYFESCICNGVALCCFLFPTRNDNVFHVAKTALNLCRPHFSFAQMEGQEKMKTSKQLDYTYTYVPPPKPIKTDASESGVKTHNPSTENVDSRFLSSNRSHFPLVTRAQADQGMPERQEGWRCALP